MDFICDLSRISSVKNFPLPTTRYYQLVSLLLCLFAKAALHGRGIVRLDWQLPSPASTTSSMPHLILNYVRTLPSFSLFRHFSLPLRILSYRSKTTNLKNSPTCRFWPTVEIAIASYTQQSNAYVAKAGFFSTSPKNSRVKKLKTQGKHSKLKHKTQGFSKNLVKIIAERKGTKSENEG